MTSKISTHVLDTSLGKPAAGLGVKLEWVAQGQEFSLVGKAFTDSQGRIRPEEFGPMIPAATHYKLTFETGKYFQASNQPCFFPEISVSFQVQSHLEHHHIPLLLSPFAYSTYRGS